VTARLLWSRNRLTSILETQLEARRREVQELHVLLQQAQKRLPPGKQEDSTEKSTVKLSFWHRLKIWGEH
jgi:hypothetical protein